MSVTTSYALALGSNRRGRHGAPAQTLAAAAAALGVERLSRIRTTEALGPGGRAFANAVAHPALAARPAGLLDELKALERAFGRRPGRRWGPRVLDLDIVLWSEGSWAGAGLIIPHPEFRRRAFVLEPLGEIAPDWRDPLTGLTIRHLLARLRKDAPVDPAPART